MSSQQGLITHQRQARQHRHGAGMNPDKRHKLTHAARIAKLRVPANLRVQTRFKRLPLSVLEPLEKSGCTLFLCGEWGLCVCCACVCCACVCMCYSVSCQVVDLGSKERLDLILDLSSLEGLGCRAQITHTHSCDLLTFLLHTDHGATDTAHQHATAGCQR